MPRSVITIQSVLDGWGPSAHVSTAGSFLSSLGIDPDLPADGSVSPRTSGSLVPVAYTDFSDTELSGVPLWLATNPKDTNLYVYTSDGEVLSYSSALSSASEAVAFSPASGAGNGMVYYNNYIYCATPTNVTRYGPLDGTPAKTDSFWTSTLSFDALTDTTYPSINGVTAPNHPMFVHTDGVLYFGDSVDGKGVIHKISTVKGTDEGDTDSTANPSGQQVLDLPFGFFPVAISNFATDLAILAIQTQDSTVAQGQAAMFLWDTTSPSVYKQIPLADPLGTALLNNNGTLFVFSGNASKGCRASVYAGGDAFQDVAYIEESYPPLAGAVDALGNRVAWGGGISEPATGGCVFSIGSKNAGLPMGLQCPVKTSGSGTSPMVTAVRYAQQADNTTPKVVVGSKDGTTNYIDKLDASGMIGSVWRSSYFNIGREAKVKKVSVPLGKAVAANTGIAVKLIADNGTSNKTLAAINNTNFPSKKIVTYQDVDFDVKHNFFLELTWSGTVTLPVMLPIRIEIESDIEFTVSE